MTVMWADSLCYMCTFGVKDNGNVLAYSCIFYAMQHCFVAKVILMILLKFMQRKTVTAQ